MENEATSLYRKYRPQRFEDVVGQGTVVKTLQETVHKGTVSHAYLFIGGRGSGKTSLAKILAKALNCPNLDKKTGEPCGVCESCLAINEATSPDVLELDAASNRGIDDIRELREKVRYKTITGEYRVFIIDEAHMLTREASNALLKTLESPPDKVVFVLCTTEDHKIMSTIKSRCQRFYFQTSSAAELHEVLARVAKAEGITVDEDAMRLISRHAGGSFRDALTILEQLRVVSQDKITGDAARQMLGETPEESVFKIIGATLRAQPREALEALDELYRDGGSLPQALQGIYYELHNLVLYRLLPDLNEHELTETELKELKELAPIAEDGMIQIFLRNLEQAQTSIGRGGDARIALTLALYKSGAGRSEDEGSGGGVDTAALAALSRRLEAVEKNRGPAPAYPVAPADAQAHAAGSAGSAEPSFTMERNLSLDEIVKRWTNLLYELRHINKIVYVVLRTARPEIRNGELVLLSWDTHSIGRNAAAITKFLEKHTNEPLTIITESYSQLEAASDGEKESGKLDLEMSDDEPVTPEAEVESAESEASESSGVDEGADAGASVSPAETKKAGGDKKAKPPAPSAASEPEEEVEESIDDLLGSLGATESS